jgi:hypothetical protein
VGPFWLPPSAPKGPISVPLPQVAVTSGVSSYIFGLASCLELPTPSNPIRNLANVDIPSLDAFFQSPKVTDTTAAADGDEYGGYIDCLFSLNFLAAVGSYSAVCVTSFWKTKYTDKDF